jgi:hypothetical protein
MKKKKSILKKIVWYDIMIVDGSDGTMKLVVGMSITIDYKY